MMKNWQPLMFGLALIIPFACTKKNEEDCGKIAAKVIRYDCDRVIFQLLTNEAIGDAQWTDVHTGASYTNVVSYYNTCEMAQITQGQITTIYADVEKTSQDLFAADCIQCAAISQHPPQTRVTMSDITTSPCTGN